MVPTFTLVHVTFGHSYISTYHKTSMHITDVHDRKSGLQLSFLLHLKMVSQMRCVFHSFDECFTLK